MNPEIATERCKRRLILCMNENRKIKIIKIKIKAATFQVLYLHYIDMINVFSFKCTFLFNFDVFFWFILNWICVRNNCCTIFIVLIALNLLCLLLFL